MDHVRAHPEHRLGDGGRAREGEDDEQVGEHHDAEHRARHRTLGGELVAEGDDDRRRLGDHHHAEDERHRRGLQGREPVHEREQVAGEEPGDGEQEERAADRYPGDPRDRAEQRPHRPELELDAGGEGDQRHRHAVDDLQALDHGRRDEVEDGRADEDAGEQVAGEAWQLDAAEEIAGEVPGEEHVAERERHAGRAAGGRLQLEGADGVHQRAEQDQDEQVHFLPPAARRFRTCTTISVASAPATTVNVTRPLSPPG